MTKTEHYQLNQWDASDYVRREDFNEDNRKIEKAIAGAGPKYCVGTYTGTGEIGSEHPHSLSFDFAPKLILILSKAGPFGGGELTLIQGVPYGFTSFWNGNVVDSVSVNAYWDGNTVTWYWVGNGTYGSTEVQSKMECNKSDTTYYYLAIG